MASIQERLDALERSAEDRGLTPVAWWIGTDHHDEVLDAVQADEEVSIEMEGGRLGSIDGRDVKLLTESPRRFALWCEEGALDL